jgi:hypothetical protein
VRRLRRPAQAIREACNNRAAVALLAHIRASEHPAIPAWCDANRVSRQVLVARLKGHRKTVDVAFLEHIERVTGGAVPAQWWLERANQDAELNQESDDDAGEDEVA